MAPSSRHNTDLNMHNLVRGSSSDSPVSALHNLDIQRSATSLKNEMKAVLPWLATQLKHSIIIAKSVASFSCNGEGDSDFLPSSLWCVLLTVEGPRAEVDAAQVLTRICYIWRCVSARPHWPAPLAPGRECRVFGSLSFTEGELNIS